MTSVTAASASALPGQDRARRLLVRLNMTMFYCLGAAALLESAAAERAMRQHAPQVDATWLRHKLERARLLRAHAGSLWPEFAWEAACAALSPGSRMLHAQARDASGASLAAGAELAKFYGALSRIAEDPVLRRDLENIASVEQSRCAEMADTAPRGLLAAVRRACLIPGRVDHARNRVVRRAFEALQQHWNDAPPFPAIDYDDFLARARASLMPHLQLDWSRRVLYRGWLAPGGSRARTCNGAASESLNSRSHSAIRSAACALPHAAELS